MAVLTSKSALRAGLAMGVSVVALGSATMAHAQTCPGTVTDGVCIVTNSGTSDAITLAPPFRFTNSGAISGAPAITGTAVTGAGAIDELRNVTQIITNAAGGTITGTAGTAISSPGVIINAGAITGSVIGAGTYVADGGTVDGAVQLGSAFSTDNFVQRGTSTGVTGPITAGNGVDFYTRSYATSGAVTLGAALPATFEVEGVEALGAGTTLTLSAPNAVSGLLLMGEGTVINTATIGTFNVSGANYPVPVYFPAIGYAGAPGVSKAYTIAGIAPNQTIFVYGLQQGAALSGFTNQGVVNGDLRMATASFTNSGAINLQSAAAGTFIFTAADRDFLFNNSGTIAMAYTGGRVGLAQSEYNLGDDDAGSAMRIISAFDSTDLKTVSLTNSGTIAGGFAANVVGKTVSFENSGTISGINQADYAIRAVELDIGELAYSLRADGKDELAADTVSFLNSDTGQIQGGVDADIGAASFTFDNRGTITNSTTRYGSDAAVLIEHGLFESDVDEAAGIPSQDATALTFRNTGLVEGVSIDSEAASADIYNDGTIKTNIRAFDPASPPFFEGKSALFYDSETNGDQSLSFRNDGDILGLDKGASGLVIDVEAGQTADETGGAPLIASASVKVVNTESIRALGGATFVPGPIVGLPQGQNVFSPIAALGINAGSATGGSTVTIENQADADITTGGNLNAITPNSYFEVANSNRAQMVAIAAAGTTVNITNAGLIDGGAGSDFSGNPNVIVDTDFYLPDRYIAGAIQTAGANPDDTGLPYVGSIDHVINTATGVIKGSIDVGANDDIIENYGSITGNVFLRDGNDLFIQSLKGYLDGIVDGGAGTDTVSFDITGSDGIVTDALRAKFINFEIETLIGTGTVVSQQQVDLTQGGTLDLEQGSTIDVGAGNTAISGSEFTGETVTNSGAITGNVDMRGGDNNVANQGTITGNVTAGDGNNSLSNQGTIAGNVGFGNGANSVTNSGNITGNVTSGAGNDQLANSGTIGGTVNLGGGSNELLLTSNWAVGGYDGTAGVDMVQASFAGTDTSPQVLDLSGFQQVEQFNVTGGTGAITGNADFDAVGVNGGRLIGLAGSTLDADVTVGSGGTFGSAGTVNGAVAVNGGGTFSPGASPAVMTVNGNVALASGSTSIFEFVPAPGQSDQLIVNGNLTIASGTTLNMVGNRPLTPGVAYDMIVANSISGTFTTVNQASTVQGFLRYTANKLQLLGTFLAPTGVSVQTGGTIDYVNNVLVSGQASSALLGAVPSLLSASGTASPAAFAQLNGEAYATASQLGTEHGLSIAKATRSGAIASPLGKAGLYSFAQGLGDWRSFHGNATAGVSRATSHSYGVLGGIGIGGESGSIGAFVGYIDSRQRIAGLNATTKADGVFAGLSGHLSAGGFDLDATIAHDWSDADTSRSVPSGTVSSSYRLHSLVLDASAGYNIALDGGWAVHPEVGVTHISTRRGGANETGSAAFALTVDGDRAKATFIDGNIALRGGQASDALIQPWAEVGVRHQLDGAATSASAGFVGGASRFIALGAERKDTIVTAGAGISAAIAPGLRVHAAYLGEFGGGNGSNVNVGVRFAF